MGKIHTEGDINKRVPEEYIQYIEKLPYLAGLDKLPYQEKDAIVNTIYSKLSQFRLSAYLSGIDIGYNRVQWLTKMGLINAKVANAISDKHMKPVQRQYVNKFVLNNDGEISAVYEPHVGSALSFIKEENKVADVGEINAVMKYVRQTFDKNIKITKEDWKIDDVFDLPDDVYDMIVLINRGWQFWQAADKRKFFRFNKYREQAYRWLQKNYTLDESWPIDEQVKWLSEERERCLENSLYLANKYLWMKDSDDLLSGESKFEAWEAQEVALFLIDLGLSLIIAKLRQIGFTTVIGGIMGLRTMLSKNFYCKMVAQKGDKSDEIFEHKIQYPIARVDSYMKPSIPNWSTDKVKFGYSSTKGGKETSASIFEVTAPAEDAINAGKPKMTLLDEIGFMKNFGAIISQGRPTMFKYDAKLKRMRMTCQVIAWGTGGKTGGVGSAMQVEWKAAKEAFAERNFRHGLIPLFINFYAKPGHDDAFYLQEKAFYYSKKKQVGEEDPKIVFHQSFPITEDDVFLESADTVVSVAHINLNIERINKKIGEEKIKETRGYFEPIYDVRKKRGEDSYVKFDVIGARFIPADQQMVSEDSPFACVTITNKPDLDYENLYYKGTDPIFSSTGHSKFATAIINAKTKKIDAFFNFKSEDYRFEYLQSLLLNIYYSRDHEGKKLGIRELLEWNVGGEYYNFCRELGYGGVFTGNKMLPDTLQTSTIDIGISKRGGNSPTIVNRLEEMLMDYSKCIDIIEFWVQLKTFVKKQTATGYRYEPSNKKLHFDDVIDAVTYAKINMDAHSHMAIIQRSEKEKLRMEGKKLRYYYDSKYNLCLGTAKQSYNAKVHGRVTGK